MLSERHIQRFSRHILLREVGGTGQQALLTACVRVPALDAAGRACALWLARSGVGALVLPEDASPAPVSDEAGLLLASDAGRPLGEAVRERLRFHFPELQFEGTPRVTAELGGDAASGVQEALRVVRGIVVSRSSG